jgi:hypothetical protein
MSYRNLKRNLFKRSSDLLLMTAAIIVCQMTYAQTADGNNGINQANTMVRSYFDTGTQLLYAIGAIVGLIGAFRVYKTMQSGHREDVGGVAAAWFGSCIFLVIVSTVLRSFFGL